MYDSQRYPFMDSNLGVRLRDSGYHALESCELRPIQWRGSDNTMSEFENIFVKQEAEICVSPQAQLVLAKTNHTVEEFVDWYFNKKKISLGGGNVIHFLEAIE